MNYFGRELSIGRLEIDTSTQNADSPALQSRLDRISENYSKLDRVLKDLEVKITENDYLKAKREQEEAARLAAEQYEIEQQLALELRRAMETESFDDVAPATDPKKPR